MTDRVVLTNKKTGQKLPEATLRNRTPSWVDIQFDGAVDDNGFRVSEWDIEYVKPSLPTEPGWYSLRGGNVAFLSVSGDWYEHSSRTVWERDPEFIASFITGRMVEVPFESDEYTPTDGQVREEWVAYMTTEDGLWGGVSEEEALAQWGRWLAERDREVAAKALRDAADEAQQGFVDEQQGIGFARVRTDWLRARADRIEKGAGDVR